MPDGTSQIVASLQPSELLVPDRRYTADVASVNMARGAIRLLFGQVGLSGELRSLLIVGMYPENIRAFLEMCKEFIPSLVNFLSRNDMSLEPLETFENEPAQTVSLAASVIASAYAGSGGVLDFYHISPMSLHKLTRRDEVAVDPIVRVDVATSLLASLILRLAELGTTLPPEPK